MKTLIVGTGAVGGYFGGKLAVAGNDLYFTAKGENLQVLENSGLTIKSIHGDFNVAINVKERFDHIENLDLIIISVKMQDTESIIPIIKEQVGRNSAVISLQNGVESDEILKKAGIATIGGIAFIGANRHAAGKVEHSAAGFITIGEHDGTKSEKVLAISEAFKQAGVECRITSRIRQAKWEKLVWNAGFNALAALTGESPAALLSHKPTAKVVRELMDEVVLVASRLEVEIDKTIVDAHIQSGLKMAGVVPSMLQDLKAGRKTEIDFINGKIFREGQKLGILTPYNESVSAAVSLIDKAAR